ncbi:MAG TPA: hypothetical protein ENG01_01445 [Candidatus Aenigmarchaeota archaeon]|nr:MAG: hypothetical protein DRN75_01750 [Nanoarchaeota archaeon]HDO80009.1 hypothetical protein [Candidatus Aenigmarchaeota archaeon]HEX33061.1 hypothetical protein [Candidatus Aenigmarchaeota archaeon]
MAKKKDIPNKHLYLSSMIIIISALVAAMIGMSASGSWDILMTIAVIDWLILTTLLSIFATVILIRDKK